MTPEELKKYVCLNDRIYPKNWGPKRMERNL